MAKTRTSTLDYLEATLIGTDPASVAGLQDARESAAVARLVYDLRHAAGLTQRELAKRVGTSHSVISRLENDDYDSHSLTMLRRIAAALEHRVEVRFVRIEATDRVRGRVL